MEIENVKHSVWCTMESFIILFKKGRTNISISISNLHNITLHPICYDSFTFCWILFWSIFILQKIKENNHHQQKALKRSLQMKLKKKSARINESIFKYTQMGQLHLVLPCLRINCSSEIRHLATSVQTGAHARRKLWITTVPSDFFHMATFLTFPSIFYPVAVFLCQKLSVGMTGTSVESDKEWKQATYPFSDCKRPTGILQVLCMHNIRYKKWEARWQF